MDKKLLRLIILAISLVLLKGQADARSSIERGSSSGGGRGGDGGSSSYGGGRGGNGGSSSYGGVRTGGYGGGQRPPVVIKMHRYNISRPNYIRNPNHVIRDNRSISYPRQFETGSRITQQSSIVPPQNHTQIVHNTAIVRNIVQQQRTEIIPSHYYWHDHGGIRYCHFYDHDIHWYGFYFGPSFYWTRYYADRWWWFDVTFNHWVYWWDGYWWWQGPGGGLYVYMDNNYYPYEEGAGGVTVSKPEVQALPESAPTPQEGRSWDSPDGKRMVQIYGSRSDAFLYDKSGGQPVFLKFIGTGVDKVRFSGGKNGKPVQILIDFKDGNFALFTSEGDPIDAAAAAPEGDSSLPPLPTAAPPSGLPPNAPPPNTSKPAPQQPDNAPPPTQP